MTSKIPFIATALTLAGLSHVAAQNGLRDIPDPSVEAQLAAFKLIEGAKINLFASEPAVSSPTHMNWDARGRLWVVNSPLYPHIQPGQEEQDKIVILEDTDGDGVADKHTDFATNLHIPTAVLPGDGGVYVANSVEVLFLRDTDGDDIADERRVILSGFGTEDTHHLVHTFRWGPEGMLWMNQSIYIHTHLETPYGVRRLLGGGMWHYRPETRRAEVFMKGLVNPWGHVFDKWGQSFLTDGAGGEGINYVFPRSVFMTSPGASRILHGLNPGQPKHCGLEILDGRHVPDELQEVFAAPDFRGNRINLFRLSEHGSSYTSTQIEDLVSSSHGAFRPIDIKMGPDGAIYVADWYNPIIQHGEVDFRDPRRDHAHGRIWRITFEGRELVKKPDIVNATEPELFQHFNAPEGWTRNAAIVELRKRLDASGEIEFSDPPEGVDPELFALRKLWVSQASWPSGMTVPLDTELAISLTEAKNHKVRAAAFRALYYDAAEIPEALVAAMKGVQDPHPQVRLWAVSVLAQLDSPDTVKIALRALEGPGTDEFLDFAVWSICREHSERWASEVKSDKNPFADAEQLLTALTALGEPVGVGQMLEAIHKDAFESQASIVGAATFVGKVGTPDQLERLFQLALANENEETVESVLESLEDATRLRKLQPTGEKERLLVFLNPPYFGNFEIFTPAVRLAGLWKLESSRPMLETTFKNAKVDRGRAEAAKDALVALGGPQSASFLEAIARDTGIDFTTRSLAVVGRTQMNSEAGAQIALAVLKDKPEGADLDRIYDAFLATKQGPGALSDALKDATLPHAIALVGMNKAQSSASRPEGLVAVLQKAGDIKPMKTALSPEEMEAMMKQIAAEGNAARGEAIYRRAALQCNVCHAIGGAGGVIGPDLVSIGASAPVDYLIDSLLEPSKKIKEGYHTTFVTLKNGDSFAGAIAREDANELVIRDATGKENRLAKSEIASNQISPVSLMPPGLTASLREDEFIDLVRFLSELGKDGAFKTPSNRFVRHWQALMPHPSTRDRIGHYGNKIFTDAISDYVWIPVHATVAGAVPLAELPDVEGRGKSHLGVLRTVLDVKAVGPVRMKLTGKLADLALFLDDKEIPLPDQGNEAELVLEVKEPGKRKLTLAGVKGQGLDAITLEVLEDAAKAGLVELRDF